MRASPPRLDRFGVLGDTRTAALVSPAGSIEWMCVPRFDAPPIFGSLVGGETAGQFSVSPALKVGEPTRRYRYRTTVLETTWQLDGRQLRLTEGMVAGVAGSLLPTTLCVRRVEAVGGEVPVVILFDPRDGYSRAPFRSEFRHGALVCTAGSRALGLTTDPLVPLEPGRPTEIVVAPGQPLVLALSAADREPLVCVAAADAWDVLLGDEHRWRLWAAGIRDGSPYADHVTRSLVTLRLLTFSPSGAPVAAPTTSLPEHLGGARNWDYRFAWPRDASIGVGAFLAVGMAGQADAFLTWLLHASRLDRPRLPPLFTLYGQRPQAERELPGWPGYAASTPVRIGNAASHQEQLDGYGWVLDAGWLMTRDGYRLHGETWRALSGMADFVCAEWRRPDAGIWEVRGPPRHHVHSKLMAWLALDRALRIAATRRTAARRTRRWLTQREAIRTDVLNRGVDRGRNTFVRSYGATDLDAALLVLPLLDFEPRSSPLVAGTIDAIRRDLHAGGPMLYRYPPGSDGLVEGEAAFLPCSFWLAQALANIGRVDEAAEVFEATAALAGPLGLFGEEIEPSSGRHLGNYPQALTHSALVQAALAIRDAVSPSIDAANAPVMSDSAAVRGRLHRPRARRPRRAVSAGRS